MDLWELKLPMEMFLLTALFLFLKYLLLQHLNFISLFFQQLSKFTKAKPQYEIKVSYLKQNLHRSKLNS